METLRQDLPEQLLAQHSPLAGELNGMETFETFATRIEGSMPPHSLGNSMEWKPHTLRFKTNHPYSSPLAGELNGMETGLSACHGWSPFFVSPLAGELNGMETSRVHTF